MINTIQQIVKQLWITAVASGAISIVFGLIAMIWPDLTLSFFIYLFSIFVLVVSVIVLGQSFTNIKIDPLWWLSMLFAICGISIGVFIIVNPDVAKAFLAVLLSVYIFSQSILDLIIASYSDDKTTKTPVVIMGILGIVFGFMVLLYPALATTAMVWVIGLFILVHGLAIEFYAFRARRYVFELVDAIKEASTDINDNNETVANPVEAEVVTKKTKRHSKRAKDTKSN